MTTTGVKQAENICSKCGRRFDSAEELRRHEVSCDVKGSTPGAADDKARKDMEIEDRFEATDN
jgi:hypothetical protein